MSPIVSLIFFISLLPAPQSDELSRIIAAQRQQDFIGIWVREFQHGDTTLSVERRIWHRHPDQSRIEFLAPEKLRGSALFIAGESVRLAGNRHVRHFGRTARGEAPTFAEALRNAIELDWIRSNYTIETGSGDLLLNRPTLHLRFVPKNPHRGRLEIWADRDTGILLRTRRFDRRNNWLSTSFFREISFIAVDSAAVAIPDSLKAPEQNRVEVDSFADLGAFIASVSEAFLHPRELPAGFHFRQAKTIHRDGKKYHHFLYGDGLMTVSLFQNRGADKPHLRHDKNGRKIAAETLTLIRGEKAGITYSLIGEIAEEELQAMAASLVVVHKGQSFAGSAFSWWWLFIAGIVILLAWGWWRTRSSARRNV
ncbi:MAG: hypothetical protein ONA90_11585 [candidate division KSB1 bacterium]|nr:hypothetical protein [candidate division KSB1 bacterium]